MKVTRKSDAERKEWNARLAALSERKRGEFERPGLGTMYEPMANGYSGIAYTRGADLVDFRRLT